MKKPEKLILIENKINDAELESALERNFKDHNITLITDKDDGKSPFIRLKLDMLLSIREFKLTLFDREGKIIAASVCKNFSAFGDGKEKVSKIAVDQLVEKMEP